MQEAMYGDYLVTFNYKIMFGGISIDSQQAMQKPYEKIQFINAGLIGDADATFNVGNTTTFPDNAYTICTWFQGLPNQTTSFYMTGRETSASNKQFQLLFDSSANNFNFLTHPAGTSSEQLTASLNFNTYKNKWLFVAATAIKASGNVRKNLYIYDENGFVSSGTSTTYTAMYSNTSNRLAVGFARNSSGNVAYSQRMSTYGFWKGVKTPEQIKEIWNYGRGLQYSQLSADQRTNLVEWWDLDDWNGTSCNGESGAENLTRATNGTTDIYKTGGDTDLYIFKQTGTFTLELPAGYSSMEYLIVAAGGGVGSAAINTISTGGGGAGGMLEGTISNPSGGTYTIVVGAGVSAANGGNSSINSIVATGGGRGAFSNTGGNAVGASGGSGGGGGGGYSGGNGGAGTSGQGNSGANGSVSNPFPSGGGGGKSGAGSGITGGAGKSNSITGTAVTYAAGGAGKNYASGFSNSTAGAANTGNGAAGGSSNGGATTAVAGGSGIVVIKLTK